MFSDLLSSNTQWVLFSTMMLGAAAGAAGVLSYWKKQSLMSDALSHAALPGVVTTFLLFQTKQLFLLITGAAITAMAGTFFIQLICRTTRIKEDTAMGMILSVFYGFGIMLLTIANRSSGNQSGLDRFILGQSASMTESDMWSMLCLAFLVAAVIFTGLKEWKLYLFDPDFGRGIGLPVKRMDIVYTAVLVTTIVIGIQAVGVVLIAALLIIPAASARYWTHSFKNMLVISAVSGGLSGVLGTLISAAGSGWPTGPFIVVVAASFFVFSLCCGKESGRLVRYWKMKRQKKQLEGIFPSSVTKEVR